MYVVRLQCTVQISIIIFQKFTDWYQPIPNVIKIGWSISDQNLHITENFPIFMFPI